MTTTAPGDDRHLPVSIRPAARADLLAVARIEQRSFPQPWPFGAFEGFLGQAGFLVADAQPAVAGYVIADTVPNGGRPIGHVKDLAVDESWRGQGLGTRLLDRALGVIDRRGVRRAKLEVRQTNEDALSLYRRFGFEPHHVISDYYADGEAAAVLLVDLAERWRPFG